ncbi:MAG: ABC transporter ATP-binding protein [Bacteroidota bacterium]
MSSLPRLNPYLWKYRRLLIPGLLFSVVSAGFTLAVPSIVRQAVDSIPRMVALHGVYAGTPIQSELYGRFFWNLAGYAGIILSFSLLSGLFMFLMRQTIVVGSRHIEYDLRNRLYQHVQTLSAKFFQDYSTGDVITRSTSDIEQVRRYAGPALMYAARSIVVTVSALVVMFVISPSLTWAALIPMPILGIGIYFMSGMIHRRSEALQSQYSTLTTRVQESLAGIRVLKAYTRERYEAEQFDTESATYRMRALDLAKVDAAFRPLFILTIGASVLVVVLVGGRQVMEGTITIGNIAEYIIYVNIMTWPVAAIGFVINMIQRADASMKRLAEVFDTVPAIQDSDETDASIAQIEGTIVFDNVSFRYEPAGPDVIEGLSFSIEAGQTLGIVGRTGSGKTTLLELIPRLLDATAGTVKVDGHDVRTIPLDVLRSSVGYVPQEAFLFSDTIGNNIRFGDLDATDEHVRQAAQEAEILDNIEDFPKGFETRVGERGITLSGGQKQRTSIARALIRRPEILLFDDSLSAVDTNTEAAILNNLRRQFGKRTVVIVSHRISAVQDADLILVLDEGRVLERGNHASLLTTDGLYADLYRKQLLQEEIDLLEE